MTVSGHEAPDKYMHVGMQTLQTYDALHSNMQQLILNRHDMQIFSTEDSYSHSQQLQSTIALSIRAEEAAEAAEAGAREFRGERVVVGAGAQYADPRFGYAAIGRVAADETEAPGGQDGAGRPVPLAPSRLHPTRDFYPGQFYRPTVRTCLTLLRCILRASCGR